MTRPELVTRLLSIWGIGIPDVGRQVETHNLLAAFEATIRAEERAKPSCYCDTMTEHWKRLAALDARRKP